LYTGGSHGSFRHEGTVWRDAIDTEEKSGEERVEMCREWIESEASREEGQRQRARARAMENRLERRGRARTLERRGKRRTGGLLKTGGNVQTRMLKIGRLETHNKDTTILMNLYITI